ncbi:hypothetical protein CHISP_3550 [Chitinispirillum alkaliphilum]|nr:hypothetical protein CHISP_3550 [Chitinispirillum alkaliphilum]
MEPKIFRNITLYILCVIFVLIQIFIEVSKPIAILVIVRNLVFLIFASQLIYTGIRGLKLKDRSKTNAWLRVVCGYSLYGIVIWTNIATINLSIDVINQNQRRLDITEERLSENNLSTEALSFLYYVKARESFIKSGEIISFVDSSGTEKVFDPTQQDIETKELLNNLKLNIIDQYIALAILAITVVTVTGFAILYKRNKAGTGARQD